MTLLDTALSSLTGQEAAAVQAQIAGILAGASPDAYAAAFADIAARRKDLEDRRGLLSRQLGSVHAPKKSKTAQASRAALEAQALEDAALVLLAPDVPGVVKRGILSKVITRVECGTGENREETQVYVPKEFTQENTMPETRNIVLIGFMGTGKSAVGRALARRTGWRHLDTDAEIERAAGKTIPQIFAEDGEAAFREQETAVLASLVGAQFAEALILSTGGGTPLRTENAALLKQLGTVVWLHVAPESILARVAHSLHERPLLTAHQADPLGQITRLLALREPQYAALADVVLETSDCANSEESAARLMERLKLL